jgi:hypothetical protein
MKKLKFNTKPNSKVAIRIFSKAEKEDWFK